MADLNVQQKNIVNQLRQAYPELKSCSDEQILSFYSPELNKIQLSEDEKISIMNCRNGKSNNKMGLKLESSQTSVSKKQEAQLKSALTARLKAVSTNVNKAEDSNGFLGKAWSWAKNTFNIGDSSNKVRKQQQADLKALQSGNIKEAFKKITGLDYTVENVNKFLKNEVQTKSETALNGYKEGQDMAGDVIADMVSGIAAVGIYTAAVAAAPFTGGASIAVGVVAAGASAAAIKTGIKCADAKSGGRKYTADNLKKDLATGAFSGVLAPITGGIGGAVGKTVATKFGIQAVKQVGKEVAEEAVEQTAKGFVKTALTNPYGYEYIGGNVLKRAGAYSAEMITGGAVSGSFDSAFRTAYDGGSIEEVGEAAVMGGVSGGAGAWFLGGGIKVFGRGMQKIFGKNNVHIDANQNMIRTDVIEDLLNKKVDLDYVAAVLRDVDDLENVLKLAELNLSPNHKIEFERIKIKLIEKVNKNIADHGSIVLQTEIPAERFTVDSKTGVRYAKATRDDIVLAHAVQNDNAVESLTYLINATRKYDENNYLSLSLVNKNSNFFGDGCDDKLCQEYGIIPKVKNKDITSAGFGQVSEYKKDFNTFIRHSSLSESPSDYVFLKTCLLDKLKENGYDLSDSDYVQLFNLLKNKEYFGEITDNIEINGNIIKAETLKNILEETHVRFSSSVMFGDPTNNEVSAIIDGIKAIYARVDNIKDVKPEILALAKENSLDIVLLGKPTKLEISNPKYFEELNELEILVKSKEINPLEFQKRKRNLKNKYESIEKENLRARTSFELNEICINNFLEKYPENFGEKYLLKLKENLEGDDIITSQIKVFIQEYIYKIKNTPTDNYDLIYNEISSIIKKITSVTPEQVKSMASNIYNKAILLRNGINEWKNKNFIQNGLYSEKDISVRIKGDNSLVSLENKILREMVVEHQGELLQAIQKGNVDVAYNHIYDLCGTRICFKLEEEVETLIDIFSEMIKKQEFEPQYIANYSGPEISPILTKDQMQAFVSLCKSYGYNVIESTAIYDSGYTGLHANGILKHIIPANLFIPIEIQVRPKAINELLDVIHIAYDVFNGKDPLKMLKGEELKRMEIFVKGFEEINKIGLKEKYYKYQVDFIKASLENSPLPAINNPKYGLKGFEYLSLEKILEFKRWQDSCKI